MFYTVAVKDREGTWVRFQVPQDVYIYIKQLEAYIHNPEASKLREVYHERFG
jgi:hypothetical protein